MITKSNTAAIAAKPDFEMKKPIAFLFPAKIIAFIRANYLFNSLLNPNIFTLKCIKLTNLFAVYDNFTVFLFL